MNPYKVVEDFESALCEYTGAKYAVTTTSCTMALLLACRWHYVLHCRKLDVEFESGLIKTFLPSITIPKRTYVGVPMSIIHAGFDVAFADIDWLGDYRLKPLPVWDSARWFYSNMFRTIPVATHEGPSPGNNCDSITVRNFPRALGDKELFMCVSFHWTKTLAIGQGGAILHDNDEADEWFRMMRFDGRQAGVEPSKQKEWVLGYHANMSPRDAAEGLHRLSVLPEHNDPLPNDDYPDLSTMEIFK